MLGCPEGPLLGLVPPWPPSAFARRGWLRGVVVLAVAALAVFVHIKVPGLAWPVHEWLSRHPDERLGWASSAVQWLRRPVEVVAGDALWPCTTRDWQHP